MRWLQAYVELGKGLVHFLVLVPYTFIKWQVCYITIDVERAAVCTKLTSNVIWLCPSRHASCHV